MTRNPRDPERTSGGSSSGSAALVAAGVCDHALGSDTGGSIRIPASYCGIVGLKPTHGLVPIAGVFPLSPSCDTVGTLTRTVRGAAALLEVLAGRPVPIGPAAGARVGVLGRQLRDPDLRPDVRARVELAVAALAGLGLDVREVDVPELDLADEALGTVVLREAFDVHRGLFDREAGGYGPGTRALLELAREIDEPGYRACTGRHGASARRVRARLRGCRRACRPHRGLSGAGRGPAVRRARRERSRPGSPAPTTWPGCLPCRSPAAWSRGICRSASSWPRPRVPRRCCCLSPPPTRREPDEGRGVQLDAARGVPRGATTGSSCRWARPSSTVTCRWAPTRSCPSGWRSRPRSRWACRCCRRCPTG